MYKGKRGIFRLRGKQKIVHGVWKWYLTLPQRFWPQGQSVSLHYPQRSLYANLLESARRLAEAGCFAIVLECVPAKLADCVTRAIPVATIGIGAGAHTDGQVLVYGGLGPGDGFMLGTELGPADALRWGPSNHRARAFHTATELGDGTDIEIERPKRQALVTLLRSEIPGDLQHGRGPADAVAG